MGQRTFARGLEYKSKGAVVQLDVDLERKTLQRCGTRVRAICLIKCAYRPTKKVLSIPHLAVALSAHYCKHAVALILEAGSIHGFTEYVSGPTELPRSVQHWVDEIKESITAQAEQAEKIKAESVIYIIDKSRFGNIPSIVLTPYLVGKKNSAGLQKVVETS